MLACEGLFDVGQEFLIFGFLVADLLDFIVIYSYVVGHYAEPAVVPLFSMVYTTTDADERHWWRCLRHAQVLSVTGRLFSRVCTTTVP